MGRGRVMLQHAIERNIRIDYPHDSASRKVVIDFLDADWVEEVVCTAEVGAKGDNSHYHIVGKFFYSNHCIVQMLKDTFKVSGEGFYNKAPKVADGGYDGAQRYACKGVDVVFAKGVDVAACHAAYWEVNRKLLAKKKDQLSVKDAALDRFKSVLHPDRREVIQFIVDAYVERKRSINDHAVLAMARLVLCTVSSTHKAAYITNLVDRML